MSGIEPTNVEVVVRPSDSNSDPAVSVIVPARNCPRHLAACLTSLQASDCGRYEIIIVDDASTDGTPEVAAAKGVRCLRLDRRGGPARARNEGARVAKGQYLLFIDADVCVHPETVRHVIEAFASDPGLAAMFGSYDDRPGAANLLSAYRNLYHHFVHQQGREEASTFWTGCGAIRAAVFRSVGGFDEGYARPCIEDIELGARLKKTGHRIALKKHILVTHLKKWTLWGMVKADLWDRAIPWTQLLLRERSVPNDLNLKVSQRVSAMLAYLLIAVVAVGIWFAPAVVVLPILGFLAIHLLDLWTSRRPVPRLAKVAGAFAAVTALAAVGASFGLWALVPLALLLGIVGLNFRFYAFFGRVRKWSFAAFLVPPLHILYYAYSGLGLALGVGLYTWNHGFIQQGSRR